MFDRMSYVAIAPTNPTQAEAEAEAEAGATVAFVSGFQYRSYLLHSCASSKHEPIRVATGGGDTQKSKRPATS